MPDAPATRILIVDDEAAQMKALCDTLRDHGYATVGFTSGKAGLAAMREKPFDLVLTDLMMPEMDGIALLSEAQAIDRNLVGIVMTGHGTIDTAVRAMKAGALDYILKPFKLSAVLPVLARAFTVRQLRIENEQLSARVSERTAELEAANEELEAFAYSVSHDLRAPLRGIDGFSNLLLKKFSPEMPAEAQRLLNNVSSGAQSMGQLIDDLLRLSRLGRQALSRSPVNISALVREVLDELLAERDDCPIELRVGELPERVGDLLLLRQVFVNLLSNAFKYTRSRQMPVVEIGCLQKENDKVFYIRDNGAGFDMRYSNKLFGAFQRLHSACEFEGTGVGLSIVKRIVQRHGGRIWAEAEVNKGATFYFTLPG
jgi:two-component system, sensor histidine kinase and response regulator